ncbi:MAG: DNA recombination protein RmuC, partial [Chloroflexi bacterium]|nr:DNA recombination protein RmuC [Chloroflexota bacterium]
MLKILAWLWNLLLRLLGIGRPKEQPAVADITEVLKAQFGSLSLEALEKAQKTFLDLAETRFKALTEAGSNDLLQKKTLIDQQLDQMKIELGRVSKLIGEFELDREKKFAELNTNLKAIGDQTAALTTSTSGLREVLASSQARGQWGERMAEDILRSAGFVEGVNYIKQTTVESGTGRPDYTFLLPRSLQLNMDVKFPFDNYVRYVEAESDSERQGYEPSFLRDVRSRIKELASREYIDPRQSTVDYVLFFIPNEGVFAFIRDEDPEAFDSAL